MDTSEPIFVSRVDIQVAFYAIGLPEPFQDIFALDSVETWEVDFARVVDQGMVNSWNEIVFPILVVGVPVDARPHSGKSFGHLGSESIHGFCGYATIVPFGAHGVCG